MDTRLAAAVTSLLVGMLLCCLPALAPPAPMRPAAHYTIEKTGPQIDWPQYGFDSGHSGYNPKEKTINASNVGQLQQAWSFSTGSGTVAGNVVEDEASSTPQPPTARSTRSTRLRESRSGRSTPEPDTRAAAAHLPSTRAWSSPSARSAASKESARSTPPPLRSSGATPFRVRAATPAHHRSSRAVCCITRVARRSAPTLP
jgi:hypothetical protein